MERVSKVAAGIAIMVVGSAPDTSPAAVDTVVVGILCGQADHVFECVGWLYDAVQMP